MVKIRTIHKNNFFSVEELTLSRNGKKFKNYRVAKPDVSVILPLIDKNHILLEKQYRPPVSHYIYEIPAGHIDKGESPIQAAKRELEEETGYVSSNIKLLAVTYPSPGILGTTEYVYVAKNLKKSKRSLDDDEEISIKKVSINTALKMIKSNQIKDDKTIVAILYYLSFR
jgi:ADP-ribose pyrophosphatase